MVKYHQQNTELPLQDGHRKGSKRQGTVAEHNCHVEEQ